MTAMTPRPGRRIPIAGPSITEREVAYVNDAATNGWYDGAGPIIIRFETALAKAFGRRFAVSLPSCTAGIHLALLACGVGPGDEVIVPEMTWIASVAPVKYVGATPVFVDIDPVSLCIDASAVKAAITPRTKAIIAVDLYGAMPDMDALQALADTHSLTLIEDSAEASGSIYKGRPAGSFGRVSLFSFHGSKTVTTGEGGALLTDDAALFERVLFLRDHGRPPGDRFFQNTEVAHKYKMSPLQAAMGTAQIERLSELVAIKRQIFAWYDQDLMGVNGIWLHRETKDFFSSYWMVTLFLDPSLGIDKFTFMEYLSKAGIDSRPVFSALSGIPAFRDTEEGRQAGPDRHTVAFDLGERGINLPSAMNLTRDEVAYVCATIRSAVQSAGRDLSDRPG